MILSWMRRAMLFRKPRRRHCVAKRAAQAAVLSLFFAPPDKLANFTELFRHSCCEASKR